MRAEDTIDAPALARLAQTVRLSLPGLNLPSSDLAVARFADIARQENLALGFRLALHPQVDLATEPRWSRIAAAFGEDADLTSELAVAYVRGLQGPDIGRSVLTMTKHFPGGDPQLDGEAGEVPAPAPSRRDGRHI